MKNYLGNLIARHMNKAEVLQPRLASRFEPQSSVLQTEVLAPETTEVDVAAADTLGADAVIAAMESPIAAPEIERRVESPRVPPSRLAETVFESSGPPPAIPNHAIHHDAAAQPAQPTQFKSAVSIISPEIDDEPTLPAELTTPTIVASDQPDKSTPSITTSARRVRSYEVSDSVTSVAPTVFPTPSTSTAAAEPRLTKSTDQVAVRDDTEQQTPRESEPARVTVERSPRNVLTKSDQILTPAPPFDFQPQVPITRTETKRERTLPARESSPPASSAPHLESRSPERPKPRHAEFLAELDDASHDSLPAVVVPAPEPMKSRSVVNSIERESQVAPSRPARFSEEVPQPHQTQRAPSLETSVVRSPRNDPMSVRMQSPDDIAPVETGPTINVTIGRIEVRAATQASEARPQKQRREQQVLSLDEYLSQRSAGGR